MVGCVQAVVGKKRLLVQLGDGQKKYMSSSQLVFLSSKEEVEMDEPLSHSPKKEEGKLLTIVADPEVGEPCMFVKVMYLYVLYFLCSVKETSTYILEEQVSEERYTELNEEEDIIMDDTRDKCWRDVTEDGDNKKNIHALSWDVYVKEKQDSIQREFLVSITHTKEGNIVWTCVKDHIINEKEHYEAIGRRGFDYKLFREDQGGSVREGLDRYTYLKHLMQL